MDKSFLDCAGSLMVEHPIMSQYVEKIEGAASVTFFRGFNTIGMEIRIFKKSTVSMIFAAF